MKTLSERQRNIAAAIVLILILSGVSFWNKGYNQRHKNVATNTQDTDQIVRTEDGVTTDLRASVQIMDTVIKPEDIEKDVAAKLGVDRQFVLPEIPDSSLNINNVNTTQGIAAYLQSNISLIEDYNVRVDELMERIYTDTITLSELNQAQKETEAIVKKLYAMPSPKDTVSLHKSLINVYTANIDLIKQAKAYQADPSEDAWKGVYADYVVINDAVLKMNENYTNLRQKYAITVK
jgi:hypothetical protein